MWNCGDKKNRSCGNPMTNIALGGWLPDWHLGIELLFVFYKSGGGKPCRAFAAYNCCTLLPYKFNIHTHLQSMVTTKTEIIIKINKLNI